MDISEWFQQQLCIKGVRLFGVDFAQDLRSVLATMSVRLSTDYSGVGTAEIALRNVCLAASASGLVFDARCFHACDVLRDCRFMLLHHRDGVSSAPCVFGGLVQRCPAHLRSKYDSLLLKARSHAATVIASGIKNAKALTRSIGHSFLREALHSSSSSSC